MRPFRAAVLQLTSTDDVAGNLARVAGYARAAVAEGASFVALPENFAWMRVAGGAPPPVASLGDSVVVRAMQALARELGVYLLLGGFPEAADDPTLGARYYNASVLIDPAGVIVAHYRKRHLFDVDLPDGTKLRESDNIVAGDAIVAATTPLATVGLSICYDIRFPEHYRALVDRGAEVLLVPAAFTVPTGRAHWHLLLRARAVESQCYLLAPAQVGEHGGGRTTYGHALVVDPWGDVVAERPDGEGFVVADLDPERLASVRRSLPALRHRRDVARAGA